MSKTTLYQIMIVYPKDCIEVWVDELEYQSLIHEVRQLGPKRQYYLKTAIGEPHSATPFFEDCYINMDKVLRFKIMRSKVI